MSPLFLDILFSLIMIAFILIVYIKQERLVKRLLKVLDKNVEFLTNYCKKQEIRHLKNIIELYSKFQVILKISKCDYISFFKYDYCDNNLLLHFLLSIDDKGSIIQDSMLESLPVASIRPDIFNSDAEIHFFYSHDIEEKDINIYKILKSRGVNKVYYKKVFDKNNLLGFIAISYKDENFVLNDVDKTEMLKIIEKAKAYI